jgi:hypothetical protein
MRLSFEGSFARRVGLKMEVENIMSASGEFAAQLHLKGMPYIIVDRNAQADLAG